MMGRIKDQALSQALTLAINAKISDLGRVQELRIDTRDKRIEASVMLHGEKEPIHAVIQGYAVRYEGERYFLEAEKVETSREWINRVAQDYLKRLNVEIPARYARIISRVL